MKKMSHRSKSRSLCGNERGGIRFSDLLLVGAFCFIGVGALGYLYENEPPDGFLHRNIRAVLDAANGARSRLGQYGIPTGSTGSTKVPLPPNDTPMVEAPPSPPAAPQPETAPVTTRELPDAETAMGTSPSIDGPPPEAFIVTDRPTDDDAPQTPMPDADFAAVEMEPVTEGPDDLMPVEEIETVPESESDDLYTWVDENGVRHFGNTPPPEGAKSAKKLGWDMKGDETAPAEPVE